jgi:hypothetical protein
MNCNYRGSSSHYFNSVIPSQGNQNYIEESTVNCVRKFFLLSFTYNLTKQDGQKRMEAE